MSVVAVLGLGEVGRVLTEELTLPAGSLLKIWDIAFPDAASAASRNALELAIAPCTSAAEAVREAELVVSAVTAAQSLEAAAVAARALAPDAWFVDLNSSAPQKKQAAATAIEGSGGRYVEAAVMSPIHPARLSAPILLGGPHAAAFVDYARPLGFTGMEASSESIGPASATKLCRSVLIKGIEMLMLESLFAARAWGVESKVLGSLSNLLPAGDWEALAAYMIERSLIHGARRSEEMLMAADTVAEAGARPLMAMAAAEQQRWAAHLRTVSGAPGLGSLLDSIRAAADSPAAAPGERKKCTS
jgi:3-hydroxyisobutyrate dehydrogenase-like beta-hydroxyacid dehydrogenase